MADGMINLTIDGAPVSVPPGTLVIEAAKQAGVLVPHYCYHPGLPVAGVCRMCLVEVEKAPKLQIACATTVTEGMVVKTQTAPAKSARQSVLEFLLINHPLDCPICDQAGECELQDFVFQEGRRGTRYGEYAKRFNPVEDFGPDVLYVPNRCILCTRCVRFMEDVAKEPVLNVSERGDRAFIGIHPEARLDHPWAGNVVDLCPVGSLLSKDFLHKARAWELDKTASICTGCSQGCNISLDTRDEVVVRVRPRPNLEVNRYFICDHGRMHYRWMNRGDRIEAPLIRRDGELQATDWDEAFDRVVGILRGAAEGGKAVALVSAGASSEALAEAKRLLSGFSWTGAFQIVMGEEAPLAGVPNLALRAERAPNAKGAENLGYTRDYTQALAAAKSAAVVLVLDEPDCAVATNGALIYLGTALSQDAACRRADVILPIANVAEEEGTFVNRDGREQRYYQAKPAPGMAQPASWVLGQLVDALGLAGAVGGGAMTFFILSSAIKVFVVFNLIMVGVALLTLLERRVCAWMQDRLGPNRVGPQGIFQPAADGLKNFLKEETSPAMADKALFTLAPIVSFVPALLTFAVIPFASPLPTRWGLVPMVVADLPVGFLYILAISSLGVYGIVLAGWSSNNKYALLGGVRASAQMISYEIALGMSTVAVLLLAGNVTLSQVIAQQQQSLWFVLPLTIAFLIFFISALAETNRLPFDLPEAEGELIAGYHTEYSAMKFSMFYIAEYSNMVTASALMATLFFGGWDIPFTTWDSAGEPTVLKTIVTLLAFGAKTFFFIFTYIWVRWTLPRFRYAQLMALGWKVLLPLALLYIAVLAVAIWFVRVQIGWAYGPGMALVLFGLNVALLVPLVWWLDRGRLVSGSMPKETT